MGASGQSQSRSPGAPADAAGRCAVLVVDDDAAIRDLLSGALSLEGYEVLTAENGAEALAVVRAADARGEAIGAIVLDLQMPELSGPGFVEAYHRLECHHAPVVLYTAEVDANERAATLRVDGVMSKLGELSTLLELVGELAALPPAALRPHGRFHPRWAGEVPIRWQVWDTWEACAMEQPALASRRDAERVALTLDQRQTARDQRAWLAHQTGAGRGKDRPASEGAASRGG